MTVSAHQLKALLLGVLVMDVLGVESIYSQGVLLHMEGIMSVKSVNSELGCICIIYSFALGYTDNWISKCQPPQFLGQDFRCLIPLPVGHGPTTMLDGFSTKCETYGNFSVNISKCMQS